ncbi:hypothetical protein F2Q70_00039602 [Brassica cretica]|uniref:Uncharacterized protein n=1 Tax=Brassica cretica TaxID=69181 RepID=A0A8S9K4N3_BRACR|nr:hypothetical protein F2Q70_00039602 [Brassica cretica]
MSRWNRIGNLRNIYSNWWSLSRFAGSSHFRASRVLCSLFCAWSSLSRQLLRFFSLSFLTSQFCCITVFNPRIHHTLSRKGTLLPLDTFSCLSNLNIHLSYVACNSVILGIQLSEHVAHPGVDFWLPDSTPWPERADPTIAVASSYLDPLAHLVDCLRQLELVAGCSGVVAGSESARP